MAFDNVRLNVNIESGAVGGPGFKTTIVTQASGKEQRQAEWQFERGSWDISYGIMDKTDYSEILSFFRARRGKHRGFRFKDWTDYAATDEIIGTGDGIERVFKLAKSYGLYSKRITRLVAGTVTVTIDGAAKLSGFTVNTATGEVTFNDTVDDIPAVDAVVRASFEFDLPVRFDIDKLDLNVVWERAASIPEIPVIELLEDDGE